MEQATAPPPHRRPPPLLPPVAARLGGFAALALLGALQWQRMVVDLSPSDALLWALIAVGTGGGLLWADRRLRGTRLRAMTAIVALLGLLGAYAAAGLSFALLAPRRLDELGAGLSHGAEALTTVTMPYAGADPWPRMTLALLGALLLVLAALLACWPRAAMSASAPGGVGAEAGTARCGLRLLALASLLGLVAIPVVALGGDAPAALGIALATLTVGFLWLERLPLRPGLGIAALLALALAGALPLAGAADRERPWFDYAAFAERLGPDAPLNFDWGHGYGPITWPRDGSEVLRVDARRPSYWKVADLDRFDGATWIDDGADAAGAAPPELDLATDWKARPAWRETLRVTLRRIATRRVIGAGTTLGVDAAGTVVEPAAEPGQWRAATALRAGDSYTVRAYVPRPSPAQLADSRAGLDPRSAPYLTLDVPTRAPRQPEPANDAAGTAARVRELRQLRRRAELRFPPSAPHGQAPAPFARYRTLVRSNDGDRALRRSPYAASWALARRLMRRSRTPYEYVVAVDRYLQTGFRYSERPPPLPPGRAALDGFLFVTRSGYCQHFSGAMALLLRMGGVPARVATGFSPGGYSKRKHAWIVRDTDAHSWVEAWFDDYGWVTFDPTPAGTPARSQIAALDRPAGVTPGTGDDGAPAGDPAARTGIRPDLLGPQAGHAGTAPAASGEGPFAWWPLAPLVGAVALLGAWAVIRRRPPIAIDRAVAELESALRRIGRPVAGLTLHQLERQPSRSPAAAEYLRALRSGRYASSASAPSARGRRALRRELGSGAGLRGRLRALLSLPPWR